MKLKELIVNNLETTIGQFSKDAGVNRTTIQAILKNGYKPNLLTTKKICKYFNVDFRDYLED